MTSKEWVQNELLLGLDCLTTYDRMMLNKVLKDLDRLEKLEQTHKNYALKIINAIRNHLCKQDEDYEREIISPKFLSDYLDLLFSDDFESEVPNDDK